MVELLGSVSLQSSPFETVTDNIRVENHNARWRTLMNAFMSFFAQMAGNSVLTYYLPSMYTRLGVESTERRLLLTFANSIVSCAGALAGSATNDWIGRRTKLWIGSIVLACLFGAVTGFSSQFEPGMKPNRALSNGGVAMVSLLVSGSRSVAHIADILVWRGLFLRLHATHGNLQRGGPSQPYASEGHGSGK